MRRPFAIATLATSLNVCLSVVLDPLMAAAAGSKSLLRNGGFETVVPQTVTEPRKRGMPVGWVRYQTDVPGQVWTLDETDAVEGRRSLRLDNRGADATSSLNTFTKSPLPATPGAHYAWTFAAKADRSDVLFRHYVFSTVRDPAAKKYGGIWFDKASQPLSRSWARYRIDVTIPSAGMAFRDVTLTKDVTSVILRFAAPHRNAAVVWVDDMRFIREDASRSNLALNGSFEVTTVPDVPDFWNRYLGPKKLLNWYTYWGVDESAAFHGKKSLRIRNPFDESHPALGVDATAMARGWPKPVAGGTYNVSAYLRSDVEKLRVRMAAVGSSRRFEVGTDWQRCAFTVKASSGRQMSFGFSPESKGTLWIDAVQITRGETLHPYAPSPQDEYLMTESAPVDALPPRREKVRCGTTERPPKIDGRLGDLAWQKAGRVTRFILLGAETPAKEQTEAFVVRDERALYIAFKCFDSRLRELVAKERRRDGQVFADDCVEVFLDLNGDRRTYLHFAANFLGTRFDERNKGNVTWDADWGVACAKGKGFWAAEIVIPFLALRPPADVAPVWGISLCRENAKANEFSFWGGGFHQPTRFAALERVAMAHVRPVALTHSPFEFFFGGKSADQLVLHTQVCNRGSGRCSLKARVKLRAEAGAGEASTKVSLGPGERKPIEIAGLPAVREGGVCEVSFVLADSETGDVLLAETDGTALLPPLLTIKSDRSFYTDEAVAQLVLQTRLSRELAEALSARMEVKDADGATLAVVERVKMDGSAETLVPIDMAKVPVGRARVRASLMRRGGQEAASAECALTKLPPSPVAVKIDQRSRTFIADGKPFVPFTACFLRTFWHYDRIDEILGQIKARGFNTICATFSYRGSVERATDGQTRGVLDRAHRLGLKVIIWLVPPGRPDETGKVKSIRSRAPELVSRWAEEEVRYMIPRARDHPALLAWYLFDEPGGPLVEADLCGKLVRLAKELDPYHPAYLNHSGFRAAFNHYKARIPSEAVCITDYPIPSRPAGSVAQDVALEFKAAEGRKPVMIWLQLWGGRGRYPTPDEERCMTYLALIHGATGLKYWPMVTCSKLLNDRVVELAEEVERLTPAIVSTQPRQRLEASVEAVDAVMLTCGHERYVLAANRGPRPVHARIRAGAQAEVEVLFEKRTIACAGDIADAFEPYARHVYVFRSKE